VTNQVKAWVYFIQAGESGPIKIGKTTCSPLERLRTLQGGHYEKLHLVGVIFAGSYSNQGTDVSNNRNLVDERLTKLEREVHSAFDEERIRGEWFELSEALAEFIKTRTDTAFGATAGKAERIGRVAEIMEEAPPF
jgi:hypothetical protein